MGSCTKGEDETNSLILVTAKELCMYVASFCDSAACQCRRLSINIENEQDPHLCYSTLLRYLSCIEIWSDACSPTLHI